MTRIDSPKRLLKALRWGSVGGRPEFFVGKVGDALWAYTMHFGCQVTDDGLFAELLASFNLPLEPMRCFVEGTIRRAPGDDPPPNLGKLIPADGAKHPTAMPVITREHQTFVRPSEAHWLEVWRTGDTDIFFNTRYLNVCRLAQPTEWTCEGEHKPMHGHRDGKPVAIIMPVRVS